MLYDLKEIIVFSLISNSYLIKILKKKKKSKII
jgi:hypothetical protein